LKRELDRRIASQWRDRGIESAGYGAKRIMLSAQQFLGRLRSMITEVPDLMRQRRLLRAQQRKREQYPQGAHELHRATLPGPRR
jgi:hypothetical protein